MNQLLNDVSNGNTTLLWNESMQKNHLPNIVVIKKEVSKEDGSVAIVKMEIDCRKVAKMMREENSKKSDHVSSQSKLSEENGIKNGIKNEGDGQEETNISVKKEFTAEDDLRHIFEAAIKVSQSFPRYSNIDNMKRTFANILVDGFGDNRFFIPLKLQGLVGISVDYQSQDAKIGIHCTGLIFEGNWNRAAALLWTAEVLDTIVLIGFEL